MADFIVKGGMFAMAVSVAADKSFQQQNIEFFAVELLESRFSNKILNFSQWSCWKVASATKY